MLTEKKQALIQTLYRQKKYTSLESINFSQGLKISKLLTQFKPKNVLQVGCGQGISTLWIESSLNYPHTHDVIDFSVDNVNEAKKLLSKYKIQKKVRFYRNYSQIELGKLFADKKLFDFILEDGEQIFDGIMADFYFLNKLLQKNGIIIFRNLWNPSVRYAIRFILNNLEYEPVELGKLERLFISKNNFISDRRMKYLARSKLEDLFVLQKKEHDDRFWQHFKSF